MNDESSSGSRNVDALIEQIRQAARHRRALPANGRAELLPGETAENAGPLNNYLAELARRNHARTELPPGYRHFPMTIPWVQRIVLRVYNLLTKDQRASNFLLRDALKTLQAAFLRNEVASRETAVLSDYVRALLLKERIRQEGTEHPGVELPQNVDRSTLNMDAFFAALGDQFRGDTDTIKQRLRVYPPLIQAAALGGPALDLGCGRGEWLELLQEAAIEGIGVEQNQLLADACRQKNLQAIEADFVTFLELSPADHWNIVTGFHVIEHLGWPAWYRSFREIHRSLKPGGMVILETPNPDNLVTAANRFYLDPTHRHPIPAALLAFAAKSLGFVSVEILALNANADGAAHSGIQAGEAAVMRMMLGPQDYALIARK